MRLVFTIILLWNSLTINCDDGFVTVWAPKNLNQYQNFNITFYSKDIPEKYFVGIEFRDNIKNLILKSDEFITVFLENSKVVNINKKLSLAVTLYSSTKSQCSTKEFIVTPEPRSYYTFIQTDKPIYKPGDEVKFRILVVDRHMKPFHMNNIKVDFLDPFGRTIHTFGDLETQYQGIFESSFKLGTTTVLGDWKIEAIVDNKEQFSTEKSFGVQKYVLPLFEVQVETNEKNYLLEDDMTISFYAKYSFGEFVTGNAELTIRNPKTEQIYVTKTFQNVNEDEAVSYNIKSDLKVKRIDEVNRLEAIVRFTEPQSGITFNKTTIFYVHKNPRYRIVPLHPPNFIPGSKIEIKVLIKDYRDEQVMKHDEDVELKHTYTTKGRRPRTSTEFLEIENGYAKHSIIIPKGVVKFDLEIKFANSETYKKEIKTNAATGAMKVLLVDYTPKSPKLNDIVKISVESDTEMDKLFAIISSNNGNVQNQVVNCYDETSCEFDVVVKEEMLPHSTVSVYHVKDKLHIYQGFTQIGAEGLSGNHLNLDLSTDRVKTKDKIRMNFATSARSRIYLLAFDKRLKFLRDGNDITRDDVVSAISSYDGDNQINTNDLTTWSACTGNELQRVKELLDHDIHLRTCDPFEDDCDEDDDEDFEEPEAKESSILRQDFPESWIFESFETGDKRTAMKEFTAPDSITTWLISAFSLNKDKGLAMAPTQELKVMNDFFVEMNLPYSIKFKEVLKLDILVFNYVGSRDNLDVDVQLENANGKQFQFIEYSKIKGVCTAIPNSNLMSSRSTKVPHTAVKKVSFYIRSNVLEGRTENIPKEVDITVKATARGRNGRIYEDQVFKKLLVEPVGVRDYTVFTEDYVLNGEKTKEHQYHVNFTEGLTGVNVIVGGDYLGNAVEMSKRFQLYPHHCLEQQTSRIKGNVEYFRYLLSKEKNPEKKHFSSFYQSLLVERTKNWSYSTKTGYRAYFLEAMASAMEIGALPKNDNIIKTELEFLKGKQNSDGSFQDFGDFPEFDKSGSTSYAETAFILIPLIKLRKSAVGKNYEQQITKAFNYLKSNQNKLKASKEGIALAAYAFGLVGETIETKNLLDELQEASLGYPGNKKCFKIKRNSEKCDMRHTSYTALAYLSINDIAKASELVNWLVKDLNLKYLYSNTHEYAVATEPIAKIASILKIDKTDLKVTVRNEKNFTASATITKRNADRIHFVEFPEYSHDVITNAEGHGYCSVTALFEKLIKIPRISPAFSLSVTPKTSRGSNFESTFEICAEYRHDRYTSLVNVIYEVEMPSGYVYAGIEGLESKYKDIKLVQPRRKGTLVYIYYNDFERNKKYCVEVKASRSFEVLDIKPAGVKVYDYNEKTNVAIEFYSAVNPSC